MKGLLSDGPAAGSVLEVGDPPLRRGIVVLDGDRLSAEGFRYYLSAVGPDGAVYRFGGQVEWPPEARLQVIKLLVDPELDSGR